MKLISFVSVILFAFLIIGCEKNNLASGDLQAEIPLLSNPTVAPDSVYLDNLTPIGGNYSVSTVVRVKMRFQGGSQAVIAKVLRPTTSDVVTTITLRDDGIAPDQVVNDSVYSGQIQFSVTRALAGRYRIQIVAQTPEGYQSNILEKSFKLARRNAAPQLSNLSMPDSATIPSTGSIKILITIAVADSDGLADVTDVHFRSIDGSNPNFKFPLRDDGGFTPDVPPSGDAAAGDGTFSFLLNIVESPSVRGTYRFLFKASDTIGDTSGTILRSFTIR